MHRVGPARAMCSVADEGMQLRARGRENTPGSPPPPVGQQQTDFDMRYRMPVPACAVVPARASSRRWRARDMGKCVNTCRQALASRMQSRRVLTASPTHESSVREVTPRSSHLVTDSQLRTPCARILEESMTITATSCVTALLLTASVLATSTRAHSATASQNPGVAACSAAFSQSPASQSCVSRGIGGRDDGYCAIRAVCTTADGSPSPSTGAFSLTEMATLHNCDGKLRAGGC